MIQPAARSPSFDELYAQIRALPQGITGEILEPGVLRTMSRPSKAHRRAAKHCLLALRAKDEGADGSGWWIEQEAEVRFPGDRLVVPDLAGWRVERVPELPDDNPLDVVPDWCCEVLSPNTARDDKSKKLPLYARSGVGWCWLVDPDLRMVEVYETIQDRAALATTAKDDETALLPPFDVRVEVGRFWLRPRGSIARQT